MIAPSAIEHIVYGFKITVFIGGDSVNARFLGENSFDFVPQCKLLLHTNHLPQCSDLSVFDSGRALVLTFGRHFEAWEQDKRLKSELRKPENQSGILNWLLDGFRAYRTRGLGAPEAVRLATRDYRKDSDKVARFMEEVLAESPDGEIRLSLLYSHYQIWCRENGQFPENSRNFRRSLEQVGVHIDKKRPKGNDENTTTMNLSFQSKGQRHIWEAVTSSRGRRDWKRLPGMPGIAF